MKVFTPERIMMTGSDGDAYSEFVFLLFTAPETSVGLWCCEKPQSRVGALMQDGHSHVLGGSSERHSPAACVG